MNDLTINWKQERPNERQLSGLWSTIKVSQIENWTNSAKTLRENINETHSDGGILLHKYKIEPNLYFDWFATRNRLDEIEFLTNFFSHNELKSYRTDLKITDVKPQVINVKHSTDIYELSGELSRIMGLGGAYKSIDQKLAWKIATDFIKNEFENRFEEFNLYHFAIPTAQWFHDIAWDYSTLLFDKRKYEVIIIDVTDSD